MDSTTQVLKSHRISNEQLESVTRFTNDTTGEVFFKVQSATRPERAYKVTWNLRYNRPQCDSRCEGAQFGICWHVRACAAAETLYRQAKRDEAEAARRLEQAALDAKAEREYLDSCQPAYHSESEIKRDQERYQSKPFSLLR